MNLKWKMLVCQGRLSGGPQDQTTLSSYRYQLVVARTGYIPLAMQAHAAGHLNLHNSWGMVPAAYREHPYFSHDKALREMNPLPECNMSNKPSISLHASSPATNLDASLRTISDLVHQEDDPEKLLQTSALIAKIINVLSNGSNEDSHHRLPAPFWSTIKQMQKLPFGITSGWKISLQPRKSIELIIYTLEFNINSIIKHNSYSFSWLIVHSLFLPFTHVSISFIHIHSSIHSSFHSYVQWLG